MGTWHAKPIFEQFHVESFFEWFGPEEERAFEVIDAIEMILEKAEIDANNRKIVWEDGARLSITEAAQRIHSLRPDLSIELIEMHVIEWIGGVVPPTYSEEQLQELDLLTEPWLEDHERQARLRDSAARTRHS